MKGKLKKSSKFNGYEINGPDIRVFDDSRVNCDDNRIETMYKLGEGVKQGSLKRFIESGLKLVSELSYNTEDWLSEEYKKKKGWSSSKISLLKLHHPSCVKDISQAQNIMKD